MVCGILARMAVRRPMVLMAAALLLAGAGGLVFQSRQSFDSEILNLLPGNARAVQGLKLYNEKFNSALELAFLIEGQDPEGTESFLEDLSAQPWVLRMLDAPPTVSSTGRETLPELAAPLLLAQGDEDFGKTLDRLDPEALKLRLTSLAGKASAGSPIARIELANDPTGLIGPVAGALSEKLQIAETFDLEAGPVQLVPVIVRQPDLSADSCTALMRDVRQFLESSARRPGAPVVSVTGRSAYVDEISRSMRRDIVLTSLVSIAAVTCLFWFAFRSLVPLAGSVLILAWSCLIALAAGSLVFDQLNVVAMGFCSILVGLGDDFSLLLYQRYVGARGGGLDRERAIADSLRQAAPGILWVALTTSLGFAAMAFSGSAGFAQLGILIAIGVAAGAVGMIAFMPLFERGLPKRTGDPVMRFCRALVRSRRVPLAAGGVFGLALVLAVLPWRPLQFDTSTQSLEPRDIPASQALARIMKLFPATFEPLMIVMPGPVAPQSLASLDLALAELRANGLITKYSTPSPLVPDPAQVRKNLEQVRALDLEGLGREISGVAEAAGLKPGAFDPAARLLAGLQSPKPLQQSLPASSPWWFVLDRMLSPAGDVISYVQLSPGADRASRQAVEKAISDAVPDALVTGWSQMLNDLVPWATRELLVFGGSVVAIILAVLIFVYRDARAFFLHVATLALAMCGTVATLKLVGRPVNLLNVLAFPLILAVGVDYGVHLLLSLREEGRAEENLPPVMKPVLISALTTITGFGALMLASNPALSGLGFVCATGVAWCLLASFLLLVPAICSSRKLKK